MEEYGPKEKAVAVDKARRDFYFYVRWMMLQTKGLKWIRAPHHLLICEALERVLRGECNRLIINIPPRYSKSELVCKFISYGLGLYPDAEFMYLSFTITLAADKTTEILRDVQHPAYREIFPEVQLTKDAGGHWKTTRGGSVYAAGTEGTITGFGAGKMREGFGGVLVIDDPIKPQDAYNENTREDVKRNFQSTVQSRVNWGTTPIVVIQQRLHEDDLSGWLLRGGNGEKWESLVLPAIQADGTALWPDKHSLEVLERMREADPYTFSGQYLQQPTPLGGGFYREDWLLVRDDSNPDVPLDERTRRAVPMPNFVDGVFAVIDTAVKDNAEHDGLAVTYWAVSLHGTTTYKLYVLDWDYTQLPADLLINWLPQVFERATQLAAECHARGGSFGAWIEDKAAGSVLLQQAERAGWRAQASQRGFVSTKQGYIARAINSKLTALGKVARHVNASGNVAAGYVKFTEAAFTKTVPFKGVVTNHLWDQVMAFSPGTKQNLTDDLADTFAYGVAIALGNSEGF